MSRYTVTLLYDNLTEMDFKYVVLFNSPDGIRRGTTRVLPVRRSAFGYRVVGRLHRSSNLFSCPSKERRPIAVTGVARFKQAETRIGPAYRRDSLAKPDGRPSMSAFALIHSCGYPGEEGG